jgi:TonB family protein
MKYSKPEKNEYTIISAMCLSLMIHFAAGGFLILSISSNLISPPKLNGINLVWISLNSGSKNNEVEIKNAHDEQPSPAVGKIAVKQADIEKTTGKPEAAQIYAAATKESINIIPSAKHEDSSTGAKDQYDNMAGYSANKTNDKGSDLNTVIAYPIYRKNPKPTYPEIARSRGYEGIVLLSAEILPDGRIGNTKIKKSSGYAILDQSAIEGVKKLWEFEPAKKSGNPVTFWMDLMPIRFTLLDKNSQS